MRLKTNFVSVCIQLLKKFMHTDESVGNGATFQIIYMYFINNHGYNER